MNTKHEAQRQQIAADMAAYERTGGKVYLAAQGETGIKNMRPITAPSRKVQTKPELGECEKCHGPVEPHWVDSMRRWRINRQCGKC